MDCVNSVGSYTCVCKSGFSGKTCQRNGSDGDSQPTTQSSKSDVSVLSIFGKYLSSKTQKNEEKFQLS